MYPKAISGIIPASLQAARLKVTAMIVIPASLQAARLKVTAMIEINPITNQIKDLRERTDSLRGYL